MIAKRQEILIQRLPATIKTHESINKTYTAIAI
jgi:hypothetical protein